MNRLDISERFAQMWLKSRSDSGKSQDFMAKSLGVSRKTIQNWESGLSCPTQKQGFEWFTVLDLQPLPYYLEVLYPEFEGLCAKSSDEDIDKAFMCLMKDLPTEIKRKILYIAVGEHGSSPMAILEMLLAHLHVPLRDRLNVANTVLTNYEIAEASDSIIEGTHIKPNIQFLKSSMNRAKAQIMLGRSEYTSMEDI